MKHCFFFLFFSFITKLACCQTTDSQRISSTCLPAGCEQCANLYFDTTTVALSTASVTAVSYELDLDRNGTNDIRFSCFRTSAHGFNNYQAKVLMLYNTKVSTSLNSGLILNHDSLDVICENLNWSSEADTLQIHHVVFPPFGSQTTKGLWNAVPKYMTLRLAGVDTIYAWVKMSVPSAGEIHIYNYGIQKGQEFVGLPEPQNNHMKITVCPNPAADYIFISIDGKKDQTYRIELIDVNGRLVFSEAAIKDGYRLNSSGFAKGVYMLKVSDHNQYSKTMKLLIE